MPINKWMITAILILLRKKEGTTALNMKMGSFLVLYSVQLIIYMWSAEPPDLCVQSEALILQENIYGSKVYGTGASQRRYEKKTKVIKKGKFCLVAMLEGYNLLTTLNNGDQQGKYQARRKVNMFRDGFIIFVPLVQIT